VQLRQSEFFGAVDHDGVGVRIVDAGFDDRRAQQQVGALLREVAHHPFEIALLHLAVADHDACFRQQLAELVAHVLDGVDLVMQEIDLPSAFELTQQRFPDDPFGKAADEGLDRQAFLRRGGDHRKVAQAFQRHGEGTRNRRRGQSKHVDLGAQRFQCFLLADAKAVFLIDDDQPETAEVHVLSATAYGFR
jgi:hypothetical protein